MNNLYSSGQAINGRVTDVVDNHRNEGNIHSWDVYYYYCAKDSVRRYGKINESKEERILVGDSIYVIYSKAEPEFHVASLDKVTHEPIGLFSAMFRIDNMLRLIPILLVGIVFFAQAIYLTKGREASG